MLTVLSVIAKSELGINIYYEERENPYYLVIFKNVGIYQVEVTNRIFKDLKKILETKKIRITTKYNVRGGLYTTCKVGNI